MEWYEALSLSLTRVPRVFVIAASLRFPPASLSLMASLSPLSLSHTHTGRELPMCQCARCIAAGRGRYRERNARRACVCAFPINRSIGTYVWPGRRGSARLSVWKWTKMGLKSMSTCVHATRKTDSLSLLCRFWDMESSIFVRRLISHFTTHTMKNFVLYPRYEVRRSKLKVKVTITAHG